MIAFDQDWINAFFSGYTYISTLASGGQKDVCLVKNDAGEKFVVKVVNPECQQERIQREIDTVRTHDFCQVPKIVAVKNIIYAGRGLFSIVEQYIDGKNLRSFLGQSTMEYELVKSIVHQLLIIVKNLEEVNIVHRDIKPENLILDNDNKIWLIDFGIALDFSKTALTSPSAKYAACTWGYAAPEQIRNLKAEISSKTDLFSIGIVAFELLTNMHPFIDGSSGQLDILYKTENIQLPPIPPKFNIPSNFDSFIHWLAARYPSQRPESATIALSYFEQLFPEVKK